MNEEEGPVLIITKNKSVNDYLGIIFKLGRYHDSIRVRYMDNYSELADGLIYGLRKSFGWITEGDVKKVEDDNKKCFYFNEGKIDGGRGRGPDHGKCKHPKSTYTACTHQVRLLCEFYKQKDKTRFLINEITICKHGAIRGL